MLTDQYPCPTPRKHKPTHSTHAHTHKGTQMAPKRTHSAALQPSFVCCQFSSFLAIVPFVPSLSSSQSLSPSQSLLFLSCFFSSLPHCNLASTSAQNALHFCFYLPLFAILFFFIFPLPFAMHFFHAASPSIFSCLVTGNIFLQPRAVLLARHTCDLFKNRFPFFLLSIFLSFFSLCFCFAFLLLSTCIAPPRDWAGLPLHLHLRFAFVCF